MATGAPCGACRFLRRKCVTDCIFAPYFCSEQLGPSTFAAIHKVFGASNVSKLLLHVPVNDRCEAVATIAYEAQARIRDPVYGCVSHIFALQQQVAYLQAQLMQAKAEVRQNLMDSLKSINSENQWPDSMTNCAGGLNVNMGSLQFQSHASYVNLNGIQNDVMSNRIQEFHSWRDETVNSSKKRPSQSTDLNELQALAFRMMKNEY